MAQKKRTKKTTQAITLSRSRGLQKVPTRLSVDLLAAIPEEEIWLASRKSARTRRAYRSDVAHFMRTLYIRTHDELSRVDHHAVLAWERLICEETGSQASSVRRRIETLWRMFTNIVNFEMNE